MGKFKADGYNHFNCDEFPAHAHWSIQGSRIRIVWGEFGTYDLDIVVDGESKSMKGGPVGGDWENDWRKATLSRNLLDNQVMEASSTTTDVFAVHCAGLAVAGRSSCSS